MKKGKLYYRYKAFNTRTIELLCNDTMYFANPSSFNDPLDSSFVIVYDSEDINEIRHLYSVLLKRRRESEILLNFKNAKVNDKKAHEFAIKRTEIEAQEHLNDIAYFATDTESYNSITEEQAEKKILLSRIEVEIHKHYTRGVACFSSSYASPVLWSHYGDQHKGICIGYSTNRNPIRIMNTVIYGDSRSINMSTLIDAFLHDDKKAQSDLDRDVLLRKAKEWKYEKELRLIDQQGNQDSPLLLTEIIFGLCCSDVVKHTIMKALEMLIPKVRFYQIQTTPNSYTLKRKTYNNGEYGDYFPKTAKSANESFDPVFEDTEI